MFFSFNLLTGAESPVREAEPPYLLIPNSYSLETYDASGNLTRQRDNAKDLTKRIQVDSQDRITQIQDGNNAILGNYWYDEGGFRIRKSSLEPKNNLFANVEILYPNKFFGLEFIESENVLSSVNNVYLNGVRIAALNEVGALAYFLTDQVDSVSLVLDDEGQTLSKMQYLPYGETFVQRGDLNFAPKYNSQELDRESGFYFYNARFYDPGIARFTSADTLIPDEYNSQAWNRFAYDYNNSVTQENAAANAAASAEKLAEKRQEWLDEQRTKPGYEDLSDQAIFDKYKLDHPDVGGSRLDLPSEVFGSFGDMFGGSLGLFNSSGEGYLNSQGEFVPRTCFIAGTLVHTATGTKKIEEIQVGDQVLSWDEESGEQEYHRVVKTFQREVNVVYTIVYSNGTQVETTSEHPFYIENKGWVAAKDLRTGELSVLSNEKTLGITSISISERATTVYNFEVEDSHSYYITKVGILVHNDCVITGPSMSLEAFNALLKYMPGASESEIEAARKLIEIGNRPVDGTLDAVFDVAAYLEAACKNGCPPDIAMAPIKLGVSGLKVASELIRSGRFKEAIQVMATGAKNWVRGGSEVDLGMAYKETMDGGKHSGFLKNMSTVPTSELQKGIASMNTNIVEHQNLINDPVKYMQQYGKGDWNTLDPRQQQHLLNVKWPGDIQRAHEQIDILTGIIRSR